MYTKKLRNKVIFVFPDGFTNSKEANNIISEYVDFSNSNFQNNLIERMHLFISFINFILKHNSYLSENTIKSVISKIEEVIVSNSFNDLKTKYKKNIFMVHKKLKELKFDYSNLLQLLS